MEENKREDVFKFWNKRFLGLLDEILAAILIGLVISFKDFFLSNILLILPGAVVIGVILYLIYKYKNKEWFQPIAIIIIICSVLSFSILFLITFIFTIYIPYWLMIIITLSFTLIILSIYILFYNHKKKKLVKTRRKIEKTYDWIYTTIGSFFVGFFLLFIQFKSGIFVNPNNYNPPTKYIIGTNVLIERENNLYYYYNNVYTDQTLDKLHGYHLFAEYFSNTANLSTFLKKYSDGNSKLEKYIEQLEATGLTCNSRKAVSLFAYLYWELINHYYYTDENYEKIEDINLRRVKLPLSKIKNEILDHLSADLLNFSQLPVLIDFSEANKNFDTRRFGDPTLFLDYLKKGVKTELNNYVAPVKIEQYANFPFYEIQYDITREVNKLKAHNLDFSQLYRYLNHISANTLINKDKIFQLELSFSSDISSSITVCLPIPIVMLDSSQREFYIKNTVRALIGKILYQGLKPSFMVIVKMMDNNHEQSFVNILEDLKQELESQSNKINVLKIKDIAMDDNTLFYQIKLSGERDNINELSKTIVYANKILQNNIKKHKDINNNFIVNNNLWQQILLIEPKT